MNILIPSSWLSDFLKTKASTEEIARYLSLCSQSVEKIHQSDDGDKILEIEITSNRPDCLSVIGIAREANAALKGNGFSLKWSQITVLLQRMQKRTYGRS